MSNHKHDGYRLSRLDVSQWPKEAQERYQERFSELMAYDHIKPEHAGAVAQCVRAEVLCARLYDWLGEHMRITRAGKYPPVLGLLMGWENSLRRSYQTLALTPAIGQRVKLLVDERPSWAVELSGEVESDNET